MSRSLRVVVVGAGVAGLTLAARLAQQGRLPLVLERAETVNEGYALALYPLGSSVLHGLGAYDRLLDTGVVADRYVVCDHDGRVMQDVDMSVITGQVGPMVMIGRGPLLEILEDAAGAVEVRRGCSPAALHDAGGHVEIELDDGAVETADLVVGCDGVHSSVRTIRFGDAAGFDAGWTLWTWWCPPERFPAGTVREWWAAGCFFGAYPAPGRVMCAAAVPTSAAAPLTTADDLHPLLERLTERVGVIDDALSDADHLFRWPMRDVRARHWFDGRVALCGDAAAGFLPTAGIGASNAMRAAAALADELSRADASTVGLALELYERRARRVVERNQTESRRLARVMFVQRRAVAWMRDEVARRYPAQRAVKQIIASMRAPF